VRAGFEPLMQRGIAQDIADLFCKGALMNQDFQIQGLSNAHWDAGSRERLKTGAD
jgi:hypothetical protein